MRALLFQNPPTHRLLKFFGVYVIGSLFFAVFLLLYTHVGVAQASWLQGLKFLGVCFLSGVGGLLIGLANIPEIIFRGYYGSFIDTILPTIAALIPIATFAVGMKTGRSLIMLGCFIISATAMFGSFLALMVHFTPP